ncbi:amino acid ABC transporter ATP-binding protein [Pluralibacter sp.]|uniref:amino acid ABC transporter ATP-binding protein n=1 Tax=Pluralibacter sp. TaxID=1920032 RepID=UPI0025E87AB7|nr:amino acid ABC transporter ATP-binding protein [Pluralibacter sp.]MBV8041826.1 amino acid ABC transporter ATP-binding protein [Pluralibacter sp.]
MTNNSSTPFLRIEGIHKFYGTDHILRGINLSVERGEVVCILGRSGSGKSTLLRTVNALEPVTAGRVVLGGTLIGYLEKDDGLYALAADELARQRARIGMVFQHFNLFPHMTVLENITMAPQLVLNEKRQDAEEQAMKLLAKVGLTDKAYAYPASLSGGQQQRVAIARALAMRPDLLLFDEPTSALDPELVGEVLGVMRQLASEGMTMLIVTHELRFVRDVAHTVVFMHDGQIAEKGPTLKVMTEPETPAAQAFFSTCR